MASAWFARVLTLAVWALAVGTATVWALRHVQAPAETIAPAAPDPLTAPAAGLQSVFGVRAAASAPQAAASATPMAAASAAAPVARLPSERFALIGVAAESGNGGVALISIDGAPPRPFEVGARIEDGLRLVKVEPRSATLAPKPPAKAFTIDLPTLARGGSRPAPAAAGGAGPSTLAGAAVGSIPGGGAPAGATRPDPGAPTSPTPFPLRPRLAASGASN